MTGQRHTWLLAALLLAGTTLEADGFQDTPEAPPSDGAIDRDPAVTEGDFGQRLKDAHAEWTAKVEAEQAKIDRYQTRNFLGDRVQLECVTYVVNEIEFVELIDAGMDEYTQRAGEGYVFCIVDITLNNVSGISNIAHLTQCVLVDQAGSRYALDEDAIFALKLEYGRTSKRPVTFHWRAGRLQPGVPVRAQVVFRIPEGTAQEDLGLEIPRQQIKVLVRLEERPEDDPPRVDRPATATWSLQDGILKRPKPSRIKLELNEWLVLTKSVHVITGIEFQDDLGSRRSTAPEEGIYLRIDSIFENSTEKELSFRGTANFVVAAEDGRRYRPVRIDVPAKVPAWDTVTMESFFLLPVSIVDDRLDLLIYQPLWGFTEPSPDTYGWIKLKP